MDDPVKCTYIGLHISLLGKPDMKLLLPTDDTI